MTGLPLGPLAQLVPRVTTLLAQRGVQTIVAGLAAGAVGGSAMMATGLVRFGEAPAPTAVALRACPGSGPVLADVATGQELLVTARSADGSWLQVYLGEPGVARAWAPASVLRLASSADALPVAECAAPATPTPFPTATATAVVTPTPSPEPTATPTEGPTATPTPTPSPTPKPTAKPDTTPPTAPQLSASTFGPTQINLSWSASSDNVGVVKYRVYRGGGQIAEVTSRSYSDTGLAPSTAYSYFVRALDAAGNISANSNTVTLTTPSGATPTPVPTPDNTAPTPSNLTTTGGSCNFVQYYIYPAGDGTPNAATITVHVTDPDDAPAALTVTLSYDPTGPYGPFSLTMSHVGSNDWQGTITANAAWDNGEIIYSVQAHDAAGNYSSTLNRSDSYKLYQSNGCVI